MNMDRVFASPSSSHQPIVVLDHLIGLSSKPELRGQLAYVYLGQDHDSNSSNTSERGLCIRDHPLYSTYSVAKTATFRQVQEDIQWLLAIVLYWKNVYHKRTSTLLDHDDDGDGDSASSSCSSFSLLTWSSTECILNGLSLQLVDLLQQQQSQQPQSQPHHHALHNDEATLAKLSALGDSLLKMIGFIDPRVRPMTATGTTLPMTPPITLATDTIVQHYASVGTTYRHIYYRFPNGRYLPEDQACTEEATAVLDYWQSVLTDKVNYIMSLSTDALKCVSFDTTWMRRMVTTIESRLRAARMYSALTTSIVPIVRLYLDQRSVQPHLVETLPWLRQDVSYIVPSSPVVATWLGVMVSLSVQSDVDKNVIHSVTGMVVDVHPVTQVATVLLKRMSLCPTGVLIMNCPCRVPCAELSESLLVM